MSNRLLLSRPGRVRPQQLFVAAERARWPRMQAAWRRYRSRRRIADLDSHALRDIGVTYAEAEAEANKAFWQP
jgi:uncharacterized protein YjiS (DUF1127 family)